MLRIVTVGDSVTLGVRPEVSASETYSAVLEEELRHRGCAVEVIRCGVGSETTAGGLARFDEILALSPQYVTLMYGLNDAYCDGETEEPRVSPSQYGENLVRMIRRVREIGARPVLLTPNPQSPFDPATAPDAARLPYRAHGDLNFMLKRHVAAMTRVGEAEGAPVLDIFALLTALGVDRDAKKSWLTDGVHPNAACHRIIGEALSGFFSQLVC